MGGTIVLKEVSMSNDPMKGEAAGVIWENGGTNRAADLLNFITGFSKLKKKHAEEDEVVDDYVQSMLSLGEEAGLLLGQAQETSTSTKRWDSAKQKGQEPDRPPTALDEQKSASSSSKWGWEMLQKKAEKAAEKKRQEEQALSRQNEEDDMDAALAEAWAEVSAE